MRTGSFTAAAVLSGLLLLTACASSGAMDGAEKLAVYEAAAGEPVNSFSYLGRISGWTPLDDTHIAVWTRPREAWLLTLAGRCNDIDFTPVISLTSQANRVYAGFDKVIVHNRSAVQMPCRIQEIRELDTTAIREAEKTAREEAQASSAGT